MTQEPFFDARTAGPSHPLYIEMLRHLFNELGGDYAIEDMQAGWVDPSTVDMLFPTPACLSMALWGFCIRSETRPFRFRITKNGIRWLKQVQEGTVPSDEQIGGQLKSLAFSGLTSVKSGSSRNPLQAIITKKQIRMKVRLELLHLQKSNRDEATWSYSTGSNGIPLEQPLIVRLSKEPELNRIRIWVYYEGDEDLAEGIDTEKDKVYQALYKELQAR